MDDAVSIIGGIIRRNIVKLQQGIFLGHAFDFLVQLNRGKLQQPYGLLQLRRKRQVLR
jgi:hypothetical protein